MEYTTLQFLKIDWLLLAAFVIAAASAVLLWRLRKMPLFAALRFPVIFFLLVTASAPVLVRFRAERKPAVAVVVDVSPSMALTKRIESAVAFISKNEAALNASVELKYYGFAASSSEVKQFSSLLKANFGPATDINSALWGVRRENSGRLSGVILITDGNHNAGALKDNWLNGLDAPVFTVAVNSGEMIKDIAINSVKVSDFAFKNVPLDITVGVAASGLAGRSTSVRLKDGTNVLAAKPLNIVSDNDSQEITLRFTPALNGNFAYQLEAEPLQGEITATNNYKNLSLNVIRDKLRVLFLSGSPSFEYAFLRHMLKNDPMVELVSFVILRNPENIMLVTDDQSSLIPFPSSELFSRDLHSFDLLLLDNFSYRKLSLNPEYFNNIKDWVTVKGGSLLMNAGPNSFSTGGWNFTAVGDILPADAPPAEDSFKEGFFRPRVVAPGHFLVSLTDGRKENEAAWKSVPELEFSQELRPKQGAEVILENPRDGSAVLSVWDKGKGRAAALGVNTTWKWALQSGTLNVYNAFWKNIIRYLTRSGKADEWQVYFDRPEYFAGQEYAVRFRRPFESDTQKLRLTVTEPSGSKSTSPLKKSGEKEWSFSGRFRESGTHVFDLNSDSAGMARTEYRFETAVSAATSREEANLNNDAQFLRDIAADTGGLYFDEYNFSLPDFYDKLKKIKQKSAVEKSPIGVSGWCLAILAGLLVFEWFLRRKKGMW
ncbi:MAG: glutamine amidotransferase [Elusimicrobiota bacterium]